MRSHMAVLRKIAEQGLDPKKAYVVSKDKLVPKSTIVSTPTALEVDFTPLKKDYTPEPVLAKELEKIPEVKIEAEPVTIEVKTQDVLDVQVEELKTEENLVAEQAVETLPVEEKPKKSPFKKKLDQKI